MISVDENAVVTISDVDRHMLHAELGCIIGAAVKAMVNHFGYTEKEAIIEIGVLVLSEVPKAIGFFNKENIDDGNRS